MRLALFEDSQSANFGPLTLMRPSFELVCGQYSLRERFLRLRQVTDWGVFIRPYLAAAYQEENPEVHVNTPGWLQGGPTLVVNGRWLPEPTCLTAIADDELGVIDGVPVYATVDPSEAILLDGYDFEAALTNLARFRRKVPARGRLLTHPWDLVNHNPAQLGLDFDSMTSTGLPIVDMRVAIVGPPTRVKIDPSAEIDPFVVIDSRNGPVTIAAGAIVQAFTRLEGPCHIGRKTQLFRANVRGGTTIGPVCRVGGEVEASIMHGFVNKYHDGFLGHSYVCPWVNLGALSTNSDLKNDYSHVSVPLSGVAVNTGLSKVGCFIGDHTRTALGSLFNTGSSVGVMCMVLPGGELLPKFVPSFSSVWHGHLASGLPLERGLQAAAVAMGRRNCELTNAMRLLLQHLHTATRDERDAAVSAFAEKRGLSIAG